MKKKEEEEQQQEEEEENKIIRNSTMSIQYRRIQSEGRRRRSKKNLSF